MFLVRSLLLRRLGPIGIALTAFDLWRRLPQSRRLQLRRGAGRWGSRFMQTVVAVSAGSARFAKGIR
jgi:hypothetical protein